MTGNGTVLERLFPRTHQVELIAAGIALHLAGNVAAALAFRFAAHSSTWLAFLS